MRFIWPILLVCFLDMLTYAMLSPVVILLFVEGPHRILAPETRYGYLLLGLFLSTYSVVQVFSVPIWGRLSIVITKRRVLLISLFGSGVGYAICGLGIYLKEVWILFFGSFVAGLTGANMSTIQALIPQESKPTHWERNFSLIGSLIGGAFIIGPQFTRLLMEYLPDKSLAFSVFSLCGFFSLLNAFIVYLFVAENGKKYEVEDSGFSLRHFTDVSLEVRYYLLFLFCVYFSWFFFIKYFQVYLLETLHLPEEYCCQGSTYLGFCCALWQSFRFFFDPQFLKSKSVILASAAMMAASLISFLWVSAFWQMVILTVALSCCYAIIVPTIMSQMFRHDSGHNDYKASLNQSVQSLAKVISPILSGALLSFSFTWPVLLSVFSMLCAFAIGLWIPQGVSHARSVGKKVVYERERNHSPTDANGSLVAGG